MNEPRKILIFSLVYLPHYVGGAEIAVQEITNRIRPEEVTFDMVTLKALGESSHERIGNVDVFRIGFTGKWGHIWSKYTFPFFATLKALHLHRKYKYHATWAIMANYAGFAAVFFKFLKPRIPFILTLQEGDPLEYILKRVRFVKNIFIKIFTKADRVQAISNYLARFATEMGHPHEVTVIPNGVDVGYFSQMFPQSALEALRLKYEKNEGDVFLVTASRLVSKNAISDVIRSLKYLEAHVRFLIIGQGQEEETLKELAEKEGLSKRVIFVGYVPHTELPKYLRISDIFIRPSISEGFGNSFVEAMAVGIPVIATPVGGIPDFLVDGKTGLFCNVADPKDIADKVKKILGNIHLAKDLSAQARKMVSDRYDWNMVADRIKKLLIEVSF